MSLRFWKSKKTASDSPSPDGSEEVDACCLNCGYELHSQANFCASCGQKCTDGRITVFELIRDFFANILNIDARIWRTLGALFIPGRLTEVFFQGRHKSYLPPLRFFFVMAIATIAAITTFELENASQFLINTDESYDYDIYRYVLITEYEDIDTLLRQRIAPESHLALDSVKTHLKNLVKDSLDVGIIFKEDAQGEWELMDFSVATADLATLAMDDIIEKYEIKGFWSQLLMRQSLKLQKEGKDLGRYMLNQMVWMLLVMMPILALVLKLLYVRRKRYYVEHLIFSFHVHAFVFILVITILLMQHFQLLNYTNASWWIGAAVLTEIYFIIALKRVYGQSWFKTTIKALILNFWYLLIFIVVLILTVIVAALLF